MAVGLGNKGVRLMRTGKVMLGCCDCTGGYVDCGCPPKPSISESNTAFVPSMPDEFNFANPIIFADINDVEGVSFIVLNGGTHTPTKNMPAIVGYNNPSIIGINHLLMVFDCTVGDVSGAVQALPGSRAYDYLNFSNCTIQNIACSVELYIKSCKCTIENCGTTGDDSDMYLYGDCNDYNNIYTADGTSVNPPGGNIRASSGNHLKFNGVITGDGIAPSVNTWSGHGGFIIMDIREGIKVDFENIIFGNGGDGRVDGNTIYPGNGGGCFSTTGNSFAGLGGLGVYNNGAHDGDLSTFCSDYITFANIVFGDGGSGNDITYPYGIDYTITNHTGNGGNGGYSGNGGDGAGEKMVRNSDGAIVYDYYGSGGSGGDIKTGMSLTPGTGGSGYGSAPGGQNGEIIPC